MELEILIKLCLQQDRRAQKELYENYKDSLYTVAYRLTRDFDLSSDLLQEAFIEAFKQLSKLKEPKFFHSWIKQILVRKAYRTLSQLKQQLPLDSIAEVSSSTQFDIDYIESAIQKLPVKSRTVFVMAEVEGFSHKEISETMSISVGTSKSQLNYAKTKLKELLKEYVI